VLCNLFAQLKEQISKKVIFLVSTVTIPVHGDVLLSDITFLIFDVLVVV